MVVDIFWLVVGGGGWWWVVASFSLTLFRTTNFEEQLRAISSHKLTLEKFENWFEDFKLIPNEHFFSISTTYIFILPISRRNYTKNISNNSLSLLWPSSCHWCLSITAANIRRHQRFSGNIERDQWHKITSRISNRRSSVGKLVKFHKFNKFHKFHRETPVMGSLFNKVAGLIKVKIWYKLLFFEKLQTRNVSNFHIRILKQYSLILNF